MPLADKSHPATAKKIGNRCNLPPTTWEISNNGKFKLQVHHARNHAAFWDGRELALTPAYDICIQAQAGNEASQATKISGNNNLSQLKFCLQAAHRFLLSKEDALSIFVHIEGVIRKYWDDVCDEAQLSEVEKNTYGTVSS